MKWPWGKQNNKLRLCIRYGDGQFAYVLCDPQLAQGEPLRILQWGTVRADGDDTETFHKAIRSLGLNAGEVLALAEPGQYQTLKVDTPNVPNEELKAAARWQIKEMVDIHVDDLTLDVMHVGGDAPRTQRQLFVIAARTSAITELSATCQALQMPVSVVDTWECALRNLQTRQAQSEQLEARATAALLLQDGQCLLTISAGGELFYTRRLDADPRLDARATGTLATKPQVDEPLGFEYTPGADFNPRHDDAEESVLIIELQRSIDLWERSWPDLPLARLYLLAAKNGDEVAALLQRELGLRTQAVNLGALFSGLDSAAANPAITANTDQQSARLSACIPLLGAALRQESREL
ncbi:type IV pilus biogenesis protein PilM [Roseateles koreensis]|uniref:MSHA biogenesis protein MshI n=1 Tax=Roseateles koreensis TaxID=2987526 RepID=A0ABT5KPR7_9BURK|nr:hypothetical protein [Roseateles koreensis]MDC8784450.1 hypothetical protein [Roseateles koreensis]